MDLSALRLQPFGAGVAVRRERGAAVWVHPLREPARVPRMLAGNGIGPRGILALTRWALPALRVHTLKSQGAGDVSLRDALDRSGVRGEPRRVVDRFLAGVLLDDTGATSNAFALLLARMFVLGVPALPADGMQALPRQLAAPLGDRITLHRKVTEIAGDANRWTVRAGGHSLQATHVVVATDWVDAAALTGVAAPASRGVVTDWWAAEAAPNLPMLWVDGRADPPGPALNTAVISAAAPSYSQSGRQLISASALLAKDGTPPPEPVLRRHAADIMRTAVTTGIR